MGIESKNALFNERIVKPPYQCSICMGEQSVDVYSVSSHFLPYFEGLGRDYLPSFPGWNVKKTPTNSGYSLIYTPNFSSSLEWISESNTMVARGRPVDFENGQALAYLGFWMMEAQRQDRSMFTMHSSAIDIEGKGVLIFGHSGAGKTSVLLGLCQKFDCQVVSNDLTVVGFHPDGSAHLLNGTKEIRLRYAAVKHRFPQLLRVFPTTSDSPWENKIAVTPQEIGLKSAEDNVCLDRVFAVHLDSDINQPLSVTKETGIAVRYTLYEDMSRIIRGTGISVFGTNNNILGYIPSLDTEQLHQNRVRAIETLVENIGIINVSSGNLEEMCEFVHEITQRDNN